MAKYYTVTDFIKSSPTFSGLSTLRGLALHRRGAWTRPRSWFCIQWGKWGEGLLTGPANMLSYYNSRRWAEGVKVVPLVLLTASDTMRLALLTPRFTDEESEAQKDEGTRQGHPAG